MSLGRRRSSADRFADAPLDGPLLEVDGVQTFFKTPRGLVRAVDGVSLTLERGKTLGIVGESGSGKSVLSRSIMGLLPEQRRAPRQHQVRGPRDRRRRQRDDAPLLGHADVDGVPGPDDLAQPGDADRQADHRVAALPPRREPRLRRRDRAGAAPVGRDPRGRAPAARVPAPALGRHAPARDDRDRAGLRSEAPLRRRAHHRARRDRAGPDPRPAPGSAARALHGDGAGHARPRRRCRPSRQHRGDVRRPDRRVRADARAVRARRATRTPRRC